MKIPIDFFNKVTWSEALKNRHIMFKGRNKYVKCSGVDVMKGIADDTIRITALNSRGEGGSCYIEIPEEKRLDVCLAILPELKDLLDRVPDEALAELVGTSLESYLEQRARKTKTERTHEEKLLCSYQGHCLSNDNGVCRDTYFCNCQRKENG